MNGRKGFQKSGKRIGIIGRELEALWGAALRSEVLSEKQTVDGRREKGRCVELMAMIDQGKR